MITFEQAKTANEFHYAAGCRFGGGPRGGHNLKTEKWRRRGRTKIWVDSPVGAPPLRTPAQYGLYGHHGHNTHDEAELYHVADECPATMAAAIMQQPAA